MAPLSTSPLLALAQALIRCPSVTPKDAGALDLVTGRLDELGFAVHDLRFGDPEVRNIYARIGDKAPHFCFAGHTDVVPAGDESAWSEPPFSGLIDQGYLFGRGAVDMKGAIAAFMHALPDVLDSGIRGSISLLITGDEEGAAIHGTRAVVDWLAERGERPDHCLVGEPTSARYMGDMIKGGRRGSLHCTITVTGIQGHVAYPHRADNPVTRLVRILNRLKAQPLDDGGDFFQPSNLEITDLHVGNRIENLIPAKAQAQVNIRFGSEQTEQKLREWIHGIAQSEIAAGKGDHASVDLEFRLSGDPFFTPPGDFSQMLERVIVRHTGREPDYSTTGGTSDARFIAKICPVIEFGLVGQTMHQVDERVAIADLECLSRIYHDLLLEYFDHFD